MILKDITTKNGVAKYHALLIIDCKPPFTSMTLTVNCYADEATYLAGGNSIWQYRLAMPSTGLSGDIQDIAHAWLILDSTSPLQGGQIVADKSDTLDAAKDRAWTAMKAARSDAESGNFIYDGGTYQINVPQITACVTIAMLAKSAGQPYKTTWTLADNSRKDFDADQMIAMGMALGLYIDGLYAKARTLRDQIDVAKDVDSLKAVKWE